MMLGADNSLQHLQPEFRRKVILWISSCHFCGIRLYMAETLRSYARSDHLYAQGRTIGGHIVTRARAGQSYHNFGLAVDVYPVIRGKITWDFNPRSVLWRRVVALAKLHGLSWGGDWRGFKDYPHFEDRPKPPLWLCRRRWRGGYHVA